MKNQINKIVQEALTLNEGKAPVRVAFCGYRDHSDSERFSVLDFVENQQITQFRSFVEKVRAFGGGDGPEDIVGGFQKALDLSWVSSSRIVMHIADAPCHGKRYHNMHDDYPSGDPSGIEPENLLSKFVDNRVHYHFIEITGYTSKMTGFFEKVYMNSGLDFSVIQLGTHPEKLCPTVVSCVSSSVRRTYTKLDL